VHILPICNDRITVQETLTSFIHLEQQTEPRHLNINDIPRRSKNPSCHGVRQREKISKLADLFLERGYTIRVPPAIIQLVFDEKSRPAISCRIATRCSDLCLPLQAIFHLHYYNFCLFFCHLRFSMTMKCHLPQLIHPRVRFPGYLLSDPSLRQLPKVSDQGGHNDLKINFLTLQW
jgi:hypothetical protein